MPRGYVKRDPLEILVEFVQDLTERVTSDNKIEYIGLCPFHDDHAPSFVYYPNDGPETGFMKCFTCWDGGDIISFVQKLYPDWKWRQVLGLACDKASADEIVRQDLHRVLKEDKDMWDYTGFASRQQALFELYPFAEVIRIFKRIDKCKAQGYTSDAQDLLRRLGV